MNGSIPYRPLGSTGEKVSCIGLGGYHLGQSHLEEADAIKLFHAAVERGINFSEIRGTTMKARASGAWEKL